MMVLDRDKKIRTWRISFTCILLFLLTWYYEVPESAWSLVTIWFVMYEYSTVGGVFNKGFLRFSGTVLSALYGIIIVYYCNNNPIINMLALIPGLFIYTYFFMGGEKGYIGTIGAVTLTIVLLNYNDISVAILRVFNVVIGILGCMFMIQFFYPKYARDELLKIQVSWFHELEHMILDYLNVHIPLDHIKEEGVNYEQRVLKTASEYNRLLSEAKIETRKAPFFIEHAKVIQERFRLIGRLFSVLTSYLLKDELRTQLWLNHELTLIAQKLQRLQLRIQVVVTQEVPVFANPEEEAILQAARTELMQHHPVIITMLESMHDVVQQLDDEVSHIVLLYKIYKPRFI